MSKHKCSLPSFWIGRYQNRLYLCETCGKGWTVQARCVIRPSGEFHGKWVHDWRRVKGVKGVKGLAS